MDTHALPAVNATLNAASAACLIAGYRLIKTKRIAAHRLTMIAALACSALFLVSYLVYHAQVGAVRFPTQGTVRAIYLTILATHTVLAIVVVPLVIRTTWLGTRRLDEAHRRIARITLPLWLYVSVTGVVIYWMLYRSPWGINA